MLRFFDTHAHLNDPQILKNIEQTVSDAATDGVEQMVAVGIDLASSRQCIQIAERFIDVVASVGIHPNSCHLAAPTDWSEIQQLLSHEKVVALGETGLDNYWDDCPLEIQIPWFENHIQISHQLGLPIIVHQRESEQHILDVFSRCHDNGQINGIMHSFTGCWETARACLDFGMYISFAGMVTFKNARSIAEVAKQIPRERILIETDSPYLTPHPHRGKRPNVPKMVVHTAKFLADLRDESLEDFAELTTENANRVFRLR